EQVSIFVSFPAQAQIRRWLCFRSSGLDSSERGRCPFDLWRFEDRAFYIYKVQMVARLFAGSYVKCLISGSDAAVQQRKRMDEYPVQGSTSPHVM
ncbi:unnamed protein product, partial [Urochloa humidicola]